MRLIKHILLMVCVIAGAVVIFQLAGRSGGTEIIGDHANEVQAALGPIEPSDGPPTLSVVLVENWFKLRYIDDAEARCGIGCRASVDLVRMIALDPREPRKTVYLRLAGALSDPACAAAVITEEARALTGPATPPACAGQIVSETAWRLPFERRF